MLRTGLQTPAVLRQKRRWLATIANRVSEDPGRIAISNFERDSYLPYPHLQNQLNRLRRRINRPLTLSEKVLYTHLSDPDNQDIRRGQSFLRLFPDRVAIHDANATMAMLQFISANLESSAIPTTIHCDHLTMAEKGAKSDLAAAKVKHREVFEFLESVSAKYNIGFWRPGSGIIHSTLFEKYAFPGGLLVGSDSHTPNAAGLAMLGIGVGGSDAVDCMSGQEWEIGCPKILGVRITGKLSGWASSKDIICKLAGITSVSGGKGKVVEFFGPGTTQLSATAMATVGNMSAEIGATSTLFPYVPSMARYLDATGRSFIAKAASDNLNLITADEGSDRYYDEVIEIDLNKLEPQINGPYSPDLAHTVSEFATEVQKHDWPQNISASLVGSCTNSSYEDMMKVAHLIKQASDAGLKMKVPFFVSTGSEEIRATIEKDGILDTLREAGVIVLSSSCGPCVGQWHRKDVDVKHNEANSVISSFNRNFTGRHDGNAGTHSFVTSPEIATAYAYSGSLLYNPVTDSLPLADGGQFNFTPPLGDELPEQFVSGGEGYQPPLPKDEATNMEIQIAPGSHRLQLLTPFQAWDYKNAEDLAVLIKVKGKCTTDHISPAGPWYDYRGHLENISNNLLTGAENSFLPDHPRGVVKHLVTGAIEPVPKVARSYQAAGMGWCIIGHNNYGEGSSREHAALEPRYLGGTVIVANSFARIHENNLKKQGLLPLTFEDPNAYYRIQSNDRISVGGVADIKAGEALDLIVKTDSGETWTTKVNHSFHSGQLPWLKAGSALNHVKALKLKK